MTAYRTAPSKAHDRRWIVFPPALEVVLRSSGRPDSALNAVAELAEPAPPQLFRNRRGTETKPFVRWNTSESHDMVLLPVQRHWSSFAPLIEVDAREDAHGSLIQIRAKLAPFVWLVQLAGIGLATLVALVDRQWWKLAVAGAALLLLNAFCVPQFVLAARRAIDLLVGAILARERGNE